MQEKGGFWKCPLCGGEWWPDEYGMAAMEERAKLTAIAAELQHQLRWSIGKAWTVVNPLTDYYVPGGSSSKSGRRRKKPKPPLMTERYII